jgi:hypothetical protein
MWRKNSRLKSSIEYSAYGSTPSWVVQAQTRIVGVWSVVLPPSSGSSHILRSPSVITYYLSHIIETGWGKTHTGIDALVSFFINLKSHPAHSYNDTPEGKQALRLSLVPSTCMRGLSLKLLKASRLQEEGEGLVYPQECHPPITHIRQPTRSLLITHQVAHATYPVPHAMHPQISDHVPPSTYRTHDPHPLPLFARSLHRSIIT